MDKRTERLRITAVKNLLESGEFESIKDVFIYIPRSVVAENIRVNNTRFKRMIDNVARFRFEELQRIAKFLGVDAQIIIDLVNNDLIKQGK